MAIKRSKKATLLPPKKAGRHRLPAVTPNPPKQPPRATQMVFDAKGRKRMV